MPKMNIQRSKLINAPIAQVYDKVADFSHWTAWSPWLLMEPEATVTVSDDCKSYSWEGQRVGSGEMSITDEAANEWVNIDLTFLKPWKSHAKVRFELKPKDDQTEVTWYMDSSLPWFMFWMKKLTEAFIGMDYERGLNLLRDYSEDGEVHSKLEFVGETDYPGCDYVGVTKTCAISDIGAEMSKDFEALGKLTADSEVTNEPFSVYHKWDMVGQKAKYTAGIPVAKVPDELPDGMISGKLPATKIYKLRHTGPYEHLGNAWTTMMNMQRGKAFKHRKGIHPFETYVSDPSNTSPNELVTDVNFAIK
ncbi:SRPBCC family protein [Marinoscillum furvescens]|uniref:DNA gyrase inhibitor GyrI n=1 Tax=Marinoscillum furvescens DSM 4134 TaxID=1122208 RepID=A0A3D9L6M4_MARFU|nr:GyrI-like domain-containing protein [Marinoscillum furvescens]REE01774.1 DNA gyrase inhibitor GyrI [Marinoscillum furvescens DSM 4134]